MLHPLPTMPCVPRSLQVCKPVSPVPTVQLPEGAKHWPWSAILPTLWEFPKVRGPQYGTLNSRILIVRTPK